MLSDEFKKGDFPLSFFEKLSYDFKNGKYELMSPKAPQLAELFMGGPLLLWSHPEGG